MAGSPRTACGAKDRWLRDWRWTWRAEPSWSSPRAQRAPRSVTSRSPKRSGSCASEWTPPECPRRRSPARGAATSWCSCPVTRTRRRSTWCSPVPSCGSGCCSPRPAPVRSTRPLQPNKPSSRNRQASRIRPARARGPVAPSPVRRRVLLRMLRTRALTNPPTRPARSLRTSRPISPARLRPSSRRTSARRRSRPQRCRPRTATATVSSPTSRPPNPPAPRTRPGSPSR